MDSLPKRAQSIMDDARAGFEPSPGARDRVYAMITGTIAAGATVASTAGAAKLGSTAVGAAKAGAAAGGSIGPQAAVTGLTLATKVGLSALVLAAAGAVVAVATRSPEPVTRSTATAARPAIPQHRPQVAVATRQPAAAAKPLGPSREPATPASSEPTEPETTATTVRAPALGASPKLAAKRAEPSRTLRTGAASAASDPLRAELALLQRASGALKGGDPGRALALLDEYRTRFPRGALSSEQKALRVLALCAAGNTALGRSERARFLASTPDSPMAAHVRAACSEGDDR